MIYLTILKKGKSYKIHERTSPNRLLEDSKNALSVGFPGREKPKVT